MLKTHIATAQSNQKRYYDRHADEGKVRKGDQVMVFMPIETQGRDRKLARPYHGPYRVLNATTTNVEVSLIDKPKDPSIFISLYRVTPSYPGMGDCSWTERRTKSQKRAQNTDKSQSTSCRNTGHRPITRSMTRQSKV